MPMRKQIASRMLLFPDLDMEIMARCLKTSRLPIEPCDGVESWVKAVNLDPLAIGLEALDHHGLNKHPA